MTEYGSSTWAARSRKRKAKRDEDRENFWRTAAADRTREVGGVRASPREQRMPVVRLLQVTRNGQVDDELNAFLPLVAISLRRTGLGLGPMGEVAQNMTDLAQFRTRILEHFFNHEYKFEGPRSPDE